MSKKSPPRLIPKEHLQFVPRQEEGQSAQLAEICGKKDGTFLGVGFVNLEDAYIRWTVTYDEVLVVLQGSMNVHIEDQRFSLGVHDSIWLPEGTSLIYEAKKALVLYSIYPAYWASSSSDSTS